jgi:hypothetical protein
MRNIRWIGVLVVATLALTSTACLTEQNGVEMDCRLTNAVPGTNIVYQNPVPVCLTPGSWPSNWTPPPAASVPPALPPCSTTPYPNPCWGR